MRGLLPSCLLAAVAGLRADRRRRAGRRPPGPSPTAWSRGDDRGAAALTDDPAAATALLASVRDVARPRRPRRAGRAGAHGVGHGHGLAGRALGPRAGPDLELPHRGGPAPRRRGDGPAWRSCLGADRRAPAARRPPAARPEHHAAEPAPVVDRSGVPLLTATPVVSVLLDRLQTGDLPAVTGALATALSPIEPSITAQTITDGAARTPDGRAYTVAVLRDTDYRTVKNAIHDLPGVRFTTSERLLAPDAGFARQVLPAVRTGLAAQLDGVARLVGRGRRRRGRHGRHARRGGAEARQHGRRSALDRAIQTAAEDAVEPLPQQAMLVAVQPSTGEPARGRPERCGGRRRGARAHRPLPAGLDVQDRDGAGRGRAGRAARPTPRWPARARP